MSSPNHSHSVPKLSSNDIELKAEEVIEYFDKGLLSSARPTPVRVIAEESKRRFGIDFRTDMDLGLSATGKKCLGLFKIRPRGIFIDASLDGTDRLPFVLAHEYGHFVFHRAIDPVKVGYADTAIADGELDFVTNRKLLSSPKDWIEWQANRFASALLMPRSTFSDSLINYQRQVGIRRNVGSVYVDTTPSSQRDLILVLDHLGRLYGVNRTNVECRLRDLEILQDHRNPSTRHIADFLMEGSE
jgi:hypothetical protein